MSDEEIEENEYELPVRKNTYRFATFSDRLAEVDVDIFRELRPVEETVSDEHSHFQTELHEQIHLDCTTHFKSFTREVKPLCMNLPMVFHHREKLVDALLQHLQVPGSLALKTLLKMTTTLAKDLRMEFYPYFPKLYTTIACLLDPSNPELLEDIFQTLGYLFKYLVKQLLRDVHDTYREMLPLFGHKRKFVRTFAAESFAYLFKKIKSEESLKKLLKSMCDDSRTAASIYLVDGFSSILFYAMKGVKYQFHSQCERTLGLLLQSLVEYAVEDETKFLDVSEWWEVQQSEVFLPLYRIQDPWFLSIFNASSKLCKHSNSNYSGVIWQLYLDEISSLKTGFITANTQKPQILLYESVVVLATEWIRYQRGTRVWDFRQLLPRIQDSVFNESVFTSSHMNERFLKQLLFTAKCLFKCQTIQAETFASDVIRPIIKSGHRNVLMNFFQELLSEEVLTLNVCHPFISTLCEEALVADQNQGLSFLLALRDPYLFKVQTSGWKHRIQLISKKDILSPILMKTMSSVKQAGTDAQKLSTLWAALSVADFIDLKFDVFEPVLIKVADGLKVLLTKNSKTPTPIHEVSEENVSSNLIAVYAQAKLTTLRMVYTYRRNTFADYTRKFMSEILKSYPSELPILRACHEILTLTDASEFGLSHELLESLLPSLLPNLRSWSKEIRLKSLQILSFFEPYTVFDPKEKQSVPSNLIDTCITIEETPVSAIEIRSATSRIVALVSLFESDRVPAALTAILPNLFLGSFHTKISMLWAPARDAFCAIFSSTQTASWAAFSAMMSSVKPFVNPYEPSQIGDRRSVLKSSSTELLLEPFLKSQVNEDVCTDGPTLFTLLLEVASKCAEYVEKSKEYMSFLLDSFNNFIESEYIKLFTRMSLETGEYSTSSKASRTMCVKKLTAYLTFFSKLRNPKKLQNSEALKEIFFRLLSRPESNVQNLAFDCLLTWKSRCLLPYKDNIKNLILDDKLRAEMANFSLSPDQEDISMDNADQVHSIRPEHRAEVIPVVIRILSAKLVHRKVTDNQKYLSKARRKAIFAYLSHLSPDEMEPLFLLLLEHFGATTSNIRSGVFEVIQTPSSVQIGMLGMLKDVTSQLRDYVSPYVHSILHILLHILEKAVSYIENDRLKSKSAAPIGSSQLTVDKIDAQTPGQNALEESDSEEEADEGEDELDEEADDQESLADGAKNDQLDTTSKSKDNDDAEGDEEDEDEEIVADAVEERAQGEERVGQVSILELKYAKQIRLQSYRRIADFIDKYPGVIRAEFWPHFFSVSENQLTLLPVENNQHAVGLIECLSAMSRSRDLFNALSQHKSALPSLFLCLSTPNTSDVVASAVLSIVENLISVEEEMDAETPLHELSANFEFLRPHSSDFLSCMEALVRRRLQQAQSIQANKTALGRFAQQQLSILARLSQHITDCALSGRMVRLLTPFLDNPRLTYPSTKDSIMVLLRSLFRNMPNVLEYVPLLSKYFRVFYTRDNRQNLCSIFVELEQRLPELNGLGALVGQLNAYSKQRIGEYDYDTRVKTLHSLQPSFLLELNRHQFPALLSNLFFFLSDEDLSIRSGASLALQKAIRFLSEVHLNTTVSEKLSSEQAKEFLDFSIAPQVISLVAKYTAQFRQEYLETLSSVAQYYPMAFPGIENLFDADPEASFFSNINHIQPHRRTKAIAKLKKPTIIEALGMATITKIILPLLVHTITDAEKESQPVIDEAITTLAAYSSKLDWTNYSKLLQRFLKDLATKPEHHRLMLRVVCSILSSFHFQLDEASCRGISSRTTQEQEEQVSLAISAAEESADGQQTEALPNKESRQIARTIMKRIVPQLEKNIVASEEMNADNTVGVSVALIRLLQLMPPFIMDSELPHIIMTLCNQLQSRSMAVRNVTRQSLREIAGMLGIRYIQFIIRQLRKSLTRGYQLHILGFTAHQLLSNIKDLQVGQLDHCLHDVLEIYIDEIFGELSTQKASAELKKFKELKDKKALPTIRFMMTCTSFPENVEFLVKALEPQLNARASPKIYGKLREIFLAITAGLCENSTVVDSQVVKYIVSLSMENQNSKIESTQALKKTKKMDSLLIYNPKEKRAAIDHNRHILREYSYTLLLELLKRKRITCGENGAMHVKQIAPILPSGLKGKDTNILMIVIRIYSEILSSKVEVEGSFVRTVVDRVFSIVKKLISSSSETAQCCFNLLMVVVKDVPTYNLSDQQLGHIVSIALNDIDKPEKHAMTFSLISAITQKKISCPELYTLMERLSAMMVTSQIPAIRVKCGNIFFRFLTEYPLTGSKLHEYLTYLVSNLNYEYPSGRKAVLEFLIKIFKRISSDVLSEYLDILFFPLVLRIVNDTDQECRELVSHAIKTLVEEMSFEKLDRLFQACIKWSLTGEKPQLKRAATQVLGFFVEVGKIDAVKTITQLRPVISDAISQALKDSEEGEVSEDHDHWKNLYFTIIMLEKIVTQKASVLWDEFKLITSDVWKLLDYPHAWVRTTVTRLIGIYFSSLGEAFRLNENRAFLLNQDNFVYSITQKHCKLLLLSSLTEPWSQQIAKNIVFLAGVMINHPSICSSSKQLAAIDNEAASESSDGEDGGDGQTSSGSSSKRASSKKSISNVGLNWLLHRLSYLGRTGEKIKRLAVFKILIALPSKYGSEPFLPYLHLLLSPFYRVSLIQDPHTPEEIQTFASEALALLRGQYRDDFAAATDRVRRAVEGKRNKRKMLAAQEAIIDPEGHAAKKIRRNHKRLENKKKKKKEHRDKYN